MRGMQGFSYVYLDFEGIFIWKFLKFSLCLYLERLWAKNVGQIAFFWKQFSKFS